MWDQRLLVIIRKELAVNDLGMSPTAEDPVLYVNRNNLEKWQE